MMEVEKHSIQAVRHEWSWQGPLPVLGPQSCRTVRSWTGLW